MRFYSDIDFIAQTWKRINEVLRKFNGEKEQEHIRIKDYERQFLTYYYYINCSHNFLIGFYLY